MSFKNRTFAIFFLLVTVAQGIHSQTTSAPTQCVQIKEKCKSNLKKTKWAFKLGGIDFKSGPVSKVGEVGLGTDLIQQMTPVVQILDQLQLSNCRLRNSTTSCDVARQRIIVLQAVTNAQLYNLALLAQMYSGNPENLKEAVLKWMVQSADLLQKIASNQFLSTNEESMRTISVANQVLTFALGQLHVERDSPEMQRILAEDPIRDRIIR